MSLHEFWVGVRTAIEAIPALLVSPEPDPGDVERTLRDAADAVAGFDQADFGFLPQSEQDQLRHSVTEFLDRVKAASPTAQPGDHAPRTLPVRLLTSLANINDLLDFHRYADPEAFRLGKLIEREIAHGQPPPGLAELRFRTGQDHTGDPGLWIQAYLDDHTTGSDEAFLATARKLREYLGSVARRVCPDRFPYLSFRSLAEEAELMEAPRVSRPTSWSRPSISR
ncbi:MAG TPA: hypothetical protein VFT74_05920 [Isosphaeraceae bacterium]|nr:hypothetical protein [Isosphaeraceae bacterium]